MTDRLNGGSLKRGDALISVAEVTTEWLIEQGACESQLKLFAEVFGEYARIDAASYRKAVENGFDLDWIARRIFSGTTLMNYKRTWRTAEARLDRVVRSAWNDMWEVVSLRGTSRQRPMVNLADYGRAKFALETYDTIRREAYRRFETEISDFYRRLGFH